ncbi:hypothetical protein ACE7GA_04855 [Roseomonas sp. CCTCC AB2023176]|uniref:hypothetical protein n=1 Tax=Roseomonas sp. CCTCC AB2023176 TaxID=3342640 RepID=UPI0035D7F14F
MSRLVNILGLLAFVLGAALLGYALYLLLAGVLGFNPWGNGAPQVAMNTLIGLALAALVCLALGWLLARASVRMELRRTVTVSAPGH